MGQMSGAAFDLDGTVVDHRGSAVAGIGASVRPVGIEPSVRGAGPGLWRRTGDFSLGADARRWQMLIDSPNLSTT
ncbi:hypothetical protein GCM10027057_22630 [Marisediminicola antarctica]